MTKNSKLTVFEEKLLIFIFENSSLDFLKKIPYLSVKEREHTGKGVFIYFIDNNAEFNKTNASLGSEIYIDTPQLKYGAGCILYIDDGKITTLEIFTHTEEEWPKEIKDFKLKTI